MYLIRSSLNNCDIYVFGHSLYQSLRIACAPEVNGVTYAGPNESHHDWHDASHRPPSLVMYRIVCALRAQSPYTGQGGASCRLCHTMGSSAFVKAVHVLGSSIVQTTTASSPLLVVSLYPEYYLSCLHNELGSESVHP